MSARQHTQGWLDTPFDSDVLLATVPLERLEVLRAEVMKTLAKELSVTTGPSQSGAEGKGGKASRRARSSNKGRSSVAGVSADGVEHLSSLVPSLLAKAEKELVDARRRMRTLAHKQVTTGQRALAILSASSDRVEQLTDRFEELGKVVEHMQETKEGYEHLRKLHFFNRNVKTVITWTESLKAVHHTKFGDMLERLEILPVYEHVKQLSKIRTRVEAMGQDRRMSRHRMVFAPYLQKQQVVDILFVTKVHEVFGDTVAASIAEALREGEGEQEEMDHAFVALVDCTRICEREAKEPVVIDPNTGRPAFSEEAVLDSLMQSVDKYWTDEILGEMSDISQNVNAIESIEPVITTLESVLQNLSVGFPLFGLLVRAFHNKVVSTWDWLANPSSNMEAHTLVQAMQVCAWYRVMMTDWGYLQYVPRPEVIDECSAQLLASAVGGMSDHMSNRARGCAIQICRVNEKTGEREELQSRPSGALYTSGPVDLFVILQQSLGSMVTKGVSRDVLVRLGNACVAAINTYLGYCKEASDFEAWWDANEDRPTPLPEEEWAISRLQYLCAFANDLVATADNLATVEAKFSSIWAVSARESAVSKAAMRSGDEESLLEILDESKASPQGGERSSSSPFAVLAQELTIDFPRYYVKEILGHVYKVTGASWEALFVLDGNKDDAKKKKGDQPEVDGPRDEKGYRLGDWYVPLAPKGALDDVPIVNPLSTILATYTDYITEDLKVLLAPEVWTVLLKQCVRHICLRYVERLLLYCRETKSSGEKSKFDTKRFASCLDRDIYAISECWTEICQHVLGDVQGSRLVELCTRAIRVVYEFFAADDTAGFNNVIQQRVLDQYADCPTFVPTIVFEKRPDLSKKQQAAFIHAWQDAIVYQHRDPATDFPTAGWDRRRATLLSDIDKKLGAEKRKGHFFSRKPTKESEKRAQEKAEKEERDRRKADREARRKEQAEKRAAAGDPSKAGKAGGGEVEVEDLAALLGS